MSPAMKYVPSVCLPVCLSLRNFDLLTAAKFTILYLLSKVFIYINRNASDILTVTFQMQKLLMLEFNLRFTNLIFL